MDKHLKTLRSSLVADTREKKRALRIIEDLENSSDTETDNDELTLVQQDGIIDEAKVSNGVSVTNSARTWHFTRPVTYIEPLSLQGTINTVKYAEASNIRLHCIGSRHSFSEVAQTDHCYVDMSLTNPYRSKKKKHKPSHHDEDVMKLNQDSIGNLKNGSDIANLIDIPASMRVWQVNHILCPDNDTDIARFGKKRLYNMGGGDVQHFAGAFSTGTHGTGGVYSAYHDMIRSIVIVSSKGKVWRVEPSNGITDKNKHNAYYAANLNEIKPVLKQDDDLFYSLLVSMGTFGIIYSLILEVTDMKILHEELVYNASKRDRKGRNRIKWNDELKAKFKKPMLQAGDHNMSIQINPYVINKNKLHSCMIKQSVPTTQVGKGKKVKRRQLWPSLFGKLNISAKISQALANNKEFAPRKVIETALKAQNDNEGMGGDGYTDLSYKVWNAGSGKLKSIGTGIEFAFPTPEIPDILDDLFIFLDDLDRRSPGYYLNAPMALRFSRPSQAYLANNYHTFKGKKVKEWCHIEILRVTGKTDELKQREFELFNHIQLHLFFKGGRPHWGLNFKFNFTEDNISSIYPKFDNWLQAFLTFNSSGVFDNEFTRKANIREAAKRLNADPLIA